MPPKSSKPTPKSNSDKSGKKRKKSYAERLLLKHSYCSIQIETLSAFKSFGHREYSISFFRITAAELRERKEFDQDSDGTISDEEIQVSVWVF